MHYRQVFFKTRILVMRSYLSRRPAILISVVFICFLMAVACMSHHFRSNYKSANRLLYENAYMENPPFLKAHLNSGDVCIFEDNWEVDKKLDVVEGHGTRYDFNRKKVYQGDIAVPFDSVAIFETNKNPGEMESNRIRALSIMATLDAAMGVFCLANPKACFGSCPTFYIEEDRTVHAADAEGFSSAILPSLEYADIDALNIQCCPGDTFSVVMKNEALETHCVKQLKLLACTIGDGCRVYQSPDNEFYLCEGQIPVKKAIGPEGNATSQLLQSDKKERISLADKDDLSTREEIFLEFQGVEGSGDLGLVIGFRQTLMTTYLIYSAMGYMGERVGDIFADIERAQQAKGEFFSGLKRALGDIDVYMWNEQNGMWELQGGFYETGPIAVNHQILPLVKENRGSQVRVKVVLNKGLWRLDYMALTHMIKKIEPMEVEPDSIVIHGKPDSLKLDRLHAPNRYLVSLPGNRYRLCFTLPETRNDCELFLYSKGYYLEWMRESWLKDKNLIKLRQMHKNTEKYLEKEAEFYKDYEKTMEKVFWNTRLDTKNFPSYEK